MKMKPMIVLLAFLCVIGAGFTSMGCSSGRSTEGNAVEANQFEPTPDLSLKKPYSDLGVDSWMGKGWGKDAYTFPNHDPAKVTNLTERIEALTVPDSILRSMSTQGLIRTILATGYFRVPSKAYGRVAGMKSLKEDFNVFPELLARQDAAKYLIQVYRKMNMKNYSGDFTYRFTEELLAQPELISTVSKGERQQLLVLLQKNAKEKSNLSEYYGQVGLGSTLWIVCRLIAYDNPDFLNKFPKVSAFLENGETFNMDSSEAQALYDYAMNFGK